jgi:uncharacterized protein (DUF305 family)
MAVAVMVMEQKVSQAGQEGEGFHFPLVFCRYTATMKLVLAVVVALGLGFFLGRSSIAPPLENSPEVVFARNMRAHHMQAVDMATRIRDRTPDQKLRILATDMLLTQQNELGQMQAWLDAWGLPLTGRDPPMDGNVEQMGMTTRAEVSSLSTIAIKEAEIKFLQLMIRHHQGGVMMAQNVLEQNPRELVKRLANGVVRGQKIDIDAMTDYLARRGAKPLAPLAPMKMDMNHR